MDQGCFAYRRFQVACPVWTLIAVASRTFELLLAGNRVVDDGEGCSGLESVPIHFVKSHCSCKLVVRVSPLRHPIPREENLLPRRCSARAQVLLQSY